MVSVADPIEVFRKENEEALEFIAQLSGAAEFISANGFSFDAFEQIVAVVEFIDEKVRKHSEKEEKYLFPLMERHINGRTQTMRTEHRELWRAFATLKESVRDVEDLRIHAMTVRDLVHSSRTIVGSLTRHIQKENKEYFPQAKEILTQAEYDQLRKELTESP